MNRSEALAPLKAGEARMPCTAGLAIRGEIRRGALLHGVDYYEEKGWFESTFILRGPADRVKALHTAIVAAFGDD